MKIRTAQELMKENMLVKHYAGSISYGTNLPTSDVDFRGIFCGDPVNVRTPFFTIRECDDVEEEDTKLFELAHFMKLCLDCNPNIIETLWVDREHIVHTTPAYELLREARHSLLSSKIAFTTSGYALAQLKRIKGHNKWINNPQSEDPPRQIDFISLIQWFGEEKRLTIDISEWNKDHRLVPYGNNLFGVHEMKGYDLFNIVGHMNSNFDAVDRNDLGNPKMVVRFNKEEYLLALDKHKHYWEWKKNRNVSRSELEEKHGYDTKHAMHLVRLLRMGVEALRDGEIVVKRPDAEELLAIRDGSWKYEDIVKYAESMDEEVRGIWYKKTDLPKKPNLKKAAQLLMDVQDLVWDN